MSEQITHSTRAATLAEILERILDKGIVIAGDIKIQVADMDLLNIKIRLLVASVEKAKEMGIDWWESDPDLSSKAKELEEQNQRLKERLNMSSPTPEGLRLTKA